MVGSFITKQYEVFIINMSIILIKIKYIKILYMGHHKT